MPEDMNNASQPSRVTPAVLAALDIGFLVSLAIMGLAWMLDPLRVEIGPLHLKAAWGVKPVLITALIVALRAGLRACMLRSAAEAHGLWGWRPFQRTAAALLSLGLFFALFESILALSRFTHDLPVVVFQGKNAEGGWDKPDTVPDPELLFVYQPGSIFQGRRINSLGFREREVNPDKPPGTVRVICMGDSCTAQGAPGYAQYLHDRLTREPPARQRWEAFNMGTHGYSSLQGLRLFERWADRLKPDFVTIYYGWNDHWLVSATDRAQMAVRMNPITGRLYDGLRRKHFFQFLCWLAQRGRVPLAAPNTQVFRVPPDDYRATLTEFVQRVRAAGAVPILVTAPHGQMGIGEVIKRYVTSIEEGVRTHGRYVEITREVARATRADLLDLARAMDNPSDRTLFAPDGIHFDLYAEEGRMTNDAPAGAQPGLQRVSEEIYRKLQEITTREDRRASGSQ